MEMKPARPVRDRLALEAEMVWRYQGGEVMVPVPLTMLRANVLVLRMVSRHTCLEAGENLFELIEDMHDVLDVLIIKSAASMDPNKVFREYPPISAIVEGL
jgi:hypothetical protein